MFLDHRYLYFQNLSKAAARQATSLPAVGFLTQLLTLDRGFFHFVST